MQIIHPVCLDLISNNIDRNYSKFVIESEIARSEVCDELTLSSLKSEEDKLPRSHARTPYNPILWNIPQSN